MRIRISSPQPLTDKDVYGEHPAEKDLTNNVNMSSLSPKALFCKSREQPIDHQSRIAKSGIWRSRSLSLAAIQDSGLDRIDFSRSSERNASPFSITSNDTKKTSNRYWLAPILCLFIFVSYYITSGP